MFALIIVIIAIILGAVTAGSTMFYGGTAYSDKSATAHASTYVTQAQQINGAITLAKVEGRSITDVASLVTGGYLASEPTSPGGAWSLDTSGTPWILSAAVDSQEICDAVNDQAASSGGPFECETDSDDHTFLYDT